MLLYDIAKTVSFLYQEPVCIIHGGDLNKGQIEINKTQNNLNIIPAKQINKFPQNKYSCICLDEAHRIYKQQLLNVIQNAKLLNQTCIFSLDSSQSLSETELKYKNEETINDYIKSGFTFSLTEKIRTNTEIADFIKAMFQIKRKSTKKHRYPVEILYAHNHDDFKEIVEYYEKKDFTYIPLTTSRFKSSSLDSLNMTNHPNTHNVIGQEFKKVIVAIDSFFYYDEEERLQAYLHPNPDYLLVRLLFQAVTRAQEALAIVVVNNSKVFKKILTIFD